MRPITNKYEENMMLNKEKVRLLEELDGWSELFQETKEQPNKENKMKLTDEQIAAWKADVEHDNNQLRECWKQIQRKQLDHEGGWWIIQSSSGEIKVAPSVGGNNPTFPIDKCVYQWLVPTLDWCEKFPEIQYIEVVNHPDGEEMAWVCDENMYTTHEEMWDAEIEDAEWQEYFDLWLADYLAIPPWASK